MGNHSLIPYIIQMNSHNYLYEDYTSEPGKPYTSWRGETKDTVAHLLRAHVATPNKRTLNRSRLVYILV